MAARDVVVVMLAGCGRIGFDAHADASHASDVAAIDSCLPAPLTTPIYSTATFADFASWTVGGTGTWMTANNRLEQSDITATIAFASHPVAGSDYRVVAKLHSFIGNAPGHAAELALRVDAPSENMIHCNWGDTNGVFDINESFSGNSSSDLVVTTVDIASISDPANVTMEFQAVGSVFECCLLGVAGAYLTTPDAAFTTGDVGVKTYLVGAGFDHFTVYE